MAQGTKGVAANRADCALGAGGLIRTVLVEAFAVADDAPATDLLMGHAVYGDIQHTGFIGEILFAGADGFPYGERAAASGT